MDSHAMRQDSALILSCSPRLGNCETAGRVYAKAWRDAAARNGAGAHVPATAEAKPSGLPRAISLALLRDYKIASCRGCSRCQKNPQLGCMLDKQDDASEVLELIAGAPHVCLIAPVYFYNVPAHLKALIDRSQLYYERRQEPWRGDHDEERPVPRRKVQVILAAARTQGEHLFKCSLLTLRYFFDALDMDLGDPLLLPGLDGPYDLEGDREAQKRIVGYAEAAYFAFGAQGE